MRTLDTPVKQIRRKIFGEVAKLGFESTDDSLIHDIEAVPYNIVQERAQYRESIMKSSSVFLIILLITQKRSMLIATVPLFNGPDS